ncbi:MAG: CocE/NonD family hydrolase [Thermoanaerobaculia bacterium]
MSDSLRAFGVVAMLSILAIGLAGVGFATTTRTPPAALDEDEELEELRRKLDSVATVEKKLMVPMRDGVELATDVYRPKAAPGEEQAPVPTIFWRTPYNFNKLRKSRLELMIPAIERGYAFIIQNERGKYFSQGEWEILGFPQTDGYDALDWIVAQDWSNGKVGTIGCSSSAEWQLALAGEDHPAHAAMVPMAAGAGIGQVGEFWEQGNWYRGGVYQMLFGVWLYSVQNTQRPRFSDEISREDMVRLSNYFDLAPEMPDVEWFEALYHLPLVDMMKEVGGPKGMYADFIQRTPNDPDWYSGGLYHDRETWGVPSYWFNSWYDVSTGPNLALYQHAVANGADSHVRNSQYMVLAPVTHCSFWRAKEKTIVGERDFGDVRLPYTEMILDFFDRFLKDDEAAFVDAPKVKYFTMGADQWDTADAWPPAGVEMETWYLSSDGKANSLYGDGGLTTSPPTPTGAGVTSDTFPYDPMNPVISLGGGVCCTGGAVTAGVFDQREREARHDVLVYTSEPLEEPLTISGFVEATLYVSSSAKDTDFSMKLVDVFPDGTAYNLDETIQRARYREGYERQVMMEPGEVYELPVSSMSTSNTFKTGHRIRLEISSSNFPRFARNLNTGGNNYDESEPVVAINTVHHSANHPSQIRLPVVTE